MRKMITALLLLSAFVLFATIGCDRENKPDASKKDEVISVAEVPWPASAAIYIARENGYFKDEGIDVHLQSYISGHLGLAAVLSKKVDFTVAGDTPLARAIVEGKPVAVVATLCEINRAIVIVARKDKGILSPHDLKGKRVGVVAGTTADFFLNIFLTTSYIDSADVTIVNLPTEKVVDALIRGEVDAVSTWSPHTIVAMEKLGDNGIILDDPSIYKMTWNLMTTKEFAESHPERVRKVLAAIVRANEFIAKHPEQARAIISKNFIAGDSRLEKEWKEYGFTTALDQSLILNLEDQARWMISKEPRGDRRLANVMDYIYTDGLEAIDPSAIEIVGRQE